MGILSKLKLVVFFFIPYNFHSQTFINSDLENNSNAISLAPSGWQMIPYTDPYCQASSSSQATVDIYNFNGPYSMSGGFGTPYSGNTFVGGGHSYSAADGWLWHEGIMQTVTGFIPDSMYQIGLYQCVVLQSTLLDPSGSWAVLVDDILIGITVPTVSTIGYLDSNLEWEKREFVFQATSTSHTLKFFPMDDDLSIEVFSEGQAGGIRMGIDSIYLKKYNCSKIFDLGPDLVFCEGGVAMLDAFQVNSSVEWSTGAITNSIFVDSSGYYSVAVTAYDCPITDSLTFFDTLLVTVVPYPEINLGDNVQFVCSNETVLLDAYSENSTYLWQDGSTESTFLVSDSGMYYVTVNRQGCITTDYVKIELKPCESRLEMPNVFTPNGDGDNDVFKPIISERIASLYTIILNRWGDIVFQTNELLVGWDGKLVDGTEISAGVYFWKVVYMDELGGQFEQYGNVSLMR
ncbi:MAG: gliding motility-associated C-terminal domain-containing protein [Crocinitomicaceae bacterium]|nr:gliding motility-associated C-terminal domain-containing protein [Crocinitomicaceae bacterium]MCF8434180.1 gliding motility-associated C-terminal domain-containing protein [Crocinitomicaceae bacterium]